MDDQNQGGQDDLPAGILAELRGYQSYRHINSDPELAGRYDLPDGLDPEVAVAMRNLASAMPLTRAKGMQALARYFTDAKP